MAGINLCVSFTRTSKELIKCRDFKAEEWGCDELAPIRKEIRDHYRKEQKAICPYCKNSISITSPLNCQIDHIVPKKIAEQFLFEPYNLCLSCADCNQNKANSETRLDEFIVNPQTRKLYPRSSKAFKIVHPHYDNYDEHILMINGWYVDNDSAKGNFTIGVCKLNKKPAAKLGYDSNSQKNLQLINIFGQILNTGDKNVQETLANTLLKGILEV